MTNYKKISKDLFSRLRNQCKIWFFLSTFSMVEYNGHSGLASFQIILLPALFPFDFLRLPSSS